MTWAGFCGPEHKNAAPYPVGQITKTSRRVYMGPAPLPGSACGMPANGSQVHEFAPPGPPPRRGIGARHRVRFDPRDGPRNVAATDSEEGDQHGPDAAPGDGAALRVHPDHHRWRGPRGPVP